jgi:2-phospho-L-lactate guanylyltransferase
VLYAVVPVKAFTRGKSRLGGVLSDPVREAFARALFMHVLSTLQQASDIRGVVVISDDPEVRELARGFGVSVASDPEERTLAAVVDAGLSVARSLGATAALVTMADLPRLSTADIDAAARALDSHDVVITPDSIRAGTNLLCLSPPDRFPTCFGHEDSFARHLRRISDLGLSVHVLERHGVCFDVDGPEDLERIG